MKSVYQEEEYSTVGLRGWIWDIVEKPDNYELQPGNRCWMVVNQLKSIIIKLSSPKRGWRTVTWEES